MAGHKLGCQTLPSCRSSNVFFKSLYIPQNLHLCSLFGKSTRNPSPYPHFQRSSNSSITSSVITSIRHKIEIGAPRITRGHKWKLKNPTPRLDISLNFFCHRIINAWNALQPETVESCSIKSFN